MTRAERAAEEAYPPYVVKTLYGEFDCNASSRLLFWRGYQQALDEMLKDAVEGEAEELYNDGESQCTVGVGTYFKPGDKVYVLKAEEEQK